MITIVTKWAGILALFLSFFKYFSSMFKICFPCMIHFCLNHYYLLYRAQCSWLFYYLWHFFHCKLIFMLKECSLILKQLVWQNGGTTFWRFSSCANCMAVTCGQGQEFLEVAELVSNIWSCLSHIGFKTLGIKKGNKRNIAKCYV